MNDVADTYRLYRRGLTWYYLRRVPPHLVSAAGKSLIKVSLNTSERAEAKKRRTFKDLEYDALFAQLALKDTEPNGSPQTQTLSSDALLDYVRVAITRDEARTAIAWVVDPPDSTDQLNEMRVDAERMLEILSDPEERPQTVNSFGRKILREQEAHPDNIHSTEFLEYVRRALIELHRRKLDRYDDHFEQRSHDPLFRVEPSPSCTFQQLTVTYLKEKKGEFEENGVGLKREHKVAAYVSTILDIVGPDQGVSNIDDDVVQHVRTSIARMPGNRTKHYPDLSVAAAIARADIDQRRRLSATTQGFYLDTLRDLLNLAVRKKFLTSNPAQTVKSLKKGGVAAEDKRKPFTDNQLIGFFSGNFYRHCAPGAAEPYAKADRDWRFWLPLLMLFTGARPNELVQLKASDVKTSDKATVYFDLMNEDRDGDVLQLKTNSSRRKIPVHPELIHIGLLKFVAHRRQDAGRQAQLFPSLKPNTYGNLAWYPARRLNEDFIPAEITVKPKQSLYSLRHNFRDALRRIEAPPDALRALAGWSDSKKAVSDHYGDPNNPDHYRKWMDRVSYEGLDLTFLHV